MDEHCIFIMILICLIPDLSISFPIHNFLKIESLQQSLHFSIVHSSLILLFILIIITIFPFAFTQLLLIILLIIIKVMFDNFAFQAQYIDFIHDHNQIFQYNNYHFVLELHMDLQQSCQYSNFAFTFIIMFLQVNKSINFEQNTCLAKYFIFAVIMHYYSKNNLNRLVIEDQNIIIID